MVSGTWRVDGIIANQTSPVLTLKPGDKTTFKYVLNWDWKSHEISFTLDVADARSENNKLAIDTLSVPFLSYVDVSYIEDFREETPQYPNAVTDDFIDWLNYHIARFNQMFADAGCQKRVHYDLLEVLNDSDPDPIVTPYLFASFPFRFHAGEGTYRRFDWYHPDGGSYRHSGWYNPDVDIDYGFLHEMGHQLGLIDIYLLDCSSEQNQVRG
jgi:hypothetical protein